MRISDWSSDVCSSDLRIVQHRQLVTVEAVLAVGQQVQQQARQRECEQQLQLGARQRRGTRWFHGSASPGPWPQLNGAWACPHAGKSRTPGGGQPVAERISSFSLSGPPPPCFAADRKNSW